MEPEHLFVRADLAAVGLPRPDRLPEVFDRARRGVYLPVEERPHDATGRYRRDVLAAARTLRRDSVFSHESAAVLLGLPVRGRWPTEVHLLCHRRTGGRSQRDVVRHCLGLEDARVVVVEGVSVTSPARTAFDLALARSFEDAVVVMDAVLRLHPEAAEELRGLIARYGRSRGHQRLLRVARFADGRSGSAWESISRLEMDRLGFPAPLLQLEVVTDARSESADFGWPEHGMLGEFDGEVKYRLDRYRQGGSAEDVVVREKNRENRLRRQYPRFARWDRADVAQGRLEGILLRAGPPKVRPARARVPAPGRRRITR